MLGRIVFESDNFFAAIVSWHSSLKPRSKSESWSNGVSKTLWCDASYSRTNFKVKYDPSSKFNAVGATCPNC